MHRLRILLTLLLCLTVPLAGWASALAPAGCAVQAHGHGSEHAHRSGTQAVARVSHLQHDDCAGEPGSGTPCKGDQCGCGCGFGACSSGVFLEMGSVPALDFLPRSAPMPDLPDTAFADARAATLLRPPIA